MFNSHNKTRRKRNKQNTWNEQKTFFGEVFSVFVAQKIKSNQLKHQNKAQTIRSLVF